MKFTVTGKIYIVVSDFICIYQLPNVYTLPIVDNGHSCICWYQVFQWYHKEEGPLSHIKHFHNSSYTSCSPKYKFFLIYSYMFQIFLLHQVKLSLTLVLWFMFWHEYVCVLSFYILGFLDLILNFPGYHRCGFMDVMRTLLKLVVSIVWVILLSVTYGSSILLPKQIRASMRGIPQSMSIPIPYLLAVVLYLLPNLLSAVLFLFPMMRRLIENSDWLVVRLLLWWAQVNLLAIILCSTFSWLCHVNFA